MEQAKVAIVGTGVGIRTHLAGIKKCAEATVIGVVGRSLKRTRELLAEAGEDSRLAAQWKELLAKNPDIICITTPVLDRDEYYQDLYNYHGHLLVEKPALTNSNDSERIKSYLPFCFNKSYVDFQLRGLKAFQYIRAWLCAGIIGNPYYISMYERTNALRQKNLSSWQYSHQTGGGQLFSMGSHLLDLSVFLLGITYEKMKCAKVQINTSIPKGEWTNINVKDPSDEFCMINIGLNNCIINLKSSAVAVGDRTFNILIEGTEGTIEFIYRSGKAVCTIFSTGRGKKLLYLNENGGFSKNEIGKLNPSIFRIAYPGYFQDIISHIHLGKDIALASLQDGIINTEVLEKADIIRMTRDVE